MNVKRIGMVGITSAVLLLAQVAPAVQAQPVAAPQEPVLEGRAVLPAQTFAPGPISGQLLGSDPINGVAVPFWGQPVQGVSAVLDAGKGEFLVLLDNGFGSKTNSTDFLLRLYWVRPDFKTSQGGSGNVEVGSFIQLRDPDQHIPFPIVNEYTNERLLTGADFDIESVRRDHRGDLWIGDEFGPYLLHFDAAGRLLEAPIELPGVQSPQNPTLEPDETANLPASGGFEGLAVTPNGKTLYPMLEKALVDDPDQRRRLIYEFDVRRRQYTGKQYQYRVEEAGYAIGDLTPLDRYRMLVIERDGEEGVEARFKQVFVIDLRRVDADGYLVKQAVLDLLNIRDPDALSLPGQPGDIGLGDPFAFPFVTIESVLPLAGNRLLIINDNNFPFSTGRNPDQPDATEFIIVNVAALNRP